jgi:hypothetical protein
VLVVSIDDTPNPRPEATPKDGVGSGRVDELPTTARDHRGVVARTGANDDNPVDDLAVMRSMRDNGIVHAPGAADGTRKELDPPLAADGFNISDPA